MENSKKSFEQIAAESRGSGALTDLTKFLLQNKKWWLLPIVLVMLMFGVLVMFAGTGAAPFIYTLF